jgi:hypothetical protein
MKIKLCAGAIALAIAGSLSNIPASSANEWAGARAEPSQMAASIDIARIKTVLRLTPVQEHYWPAVESALRALGRQQSQAPAEQAGFVRRISHRVVSVVLNGAAVERLAVAARPLIGALDDDQRRAAVGLAQEMGLGPVVAALN